MSAWGNHIARAGLGASILTVSAWVGATHAAAQSDSGPRTLPGTEITNTAFVSFTSGGVESTRDSVTTNEAVFVIDDPRPGAGQPPLIDFLRYAPTATDPEQVTIVGSDFSPSGATEGPFTALAPPTNPGGVTIPTDGRVPLLESETFLAGETLFVRVTDCGARRNPDEVETVVITIAGESGDLITLRLYENGPDSCEFFAYVPSTRAQSAQNDGQLTTPANEVLTASYRDALSGTDVVIDTALVDPLNRVFSSTTGELIDGAEITLVDAATGQPVETLGVDAFSTFPAKQTSGDAVTDSAGLVYELGPGEFQFPHVPQGSYFIEVRPPRGYTFASSFDRDVIQQNTDGSFVITDASYGLEFLQGRAGPLRFDIPLDPQTDLVVTKSADRLVADVGDYVAYTLTVENAGTQTVPVQVSDLLPLGFRYVPGTARREQAETADPEINPQGNALTFAMGDMAPGERITLRYALNVGPGAPLGDAVNTAWAQDLLGNSQSNIARAEVRLREDLLRSTATIIGRITENSCDPDEDWARDVERGEGVEGVRLYMEDGAYVVTDASGLYHFEGVTEGTHVVQVDKETLPKGYEMMVCEETTRYAGRAFSTFVDVQGGGIWRANFYLRRTGEVEETVVEEAYNQARENRSTYGAAWLEEQTPEPAIVYPATKDSLQKASLDMGVKHAPDQSVRLTLNGRVVPDIHVTARIRNIGNSVMLTRFEGVDVGEGGNRAVAEVLNADGTVAKVLEREVAHVTQLSRAFAMPDQSVLVADGRTVPKLAVRLEDEAGRPLFQGRRVRVDLDEDYLLYDPDRDLRIEDERVLNSELSARDEFEVGADGILEVPVEPTLKTGKISLVITLDSGRQVPLHFYLEPEKRDWIVVGLAEGTVGYKTVADRALQISESDDDVLTDGRVAFFAKGLIKGEWLMTLAVDTDQRRSGLGDRDAGFREEIDPNAYYTLYGDRSYQQFEGVSRYPVYLKLEKRQGYALFGDFNTDIPEGRLTAYNRRLSGLKAEYIGENIQVLGFGAETNQGFALDEIAADSTSGTYQLSNTRILPQSEEIVIETRDRVRPDIVLERRTLVRFLDYTLDYFTGELIFRLPVDATDVNFNPNVIVAEYETSEDVERNITFGGRAQVELANDRVRIGSTAVREDGSALAAGSDSVLVGVDVLAQVSDSTEVRAEYAISEDRTTGETADALLGEIIHTSDGVQAEAYYRREEPGFGLGQRTSNTVGAERYGVRADVRLQRLEDEETGKLTVRSIGGAAYHEESLATGNQRQNAEVTLRQDGERLDVVGGLRVTRDEFTDGETRDSVIATGSVQYAIPKHGANVSLSHEQPIGGEDEVSIYPARTILGVDKSVGDWAVATVRHEILEGAQANSHNTTVGLTTSPWTGSSVTLATDLITQDSTRRLGATVGVDQQIQVSERWALSAGVRSRRMLDEQGEYRDPVPDAAISPFEQNESFNSAYVGAAYRDDVTAVTGRIEGRSSSQGDTYIATLGAARELSEKLSLAASARSFVSEPEGSSRASSLTEARVGVAWRPRNEDTVVLNRLDLVDQKAADGTDTNKLVNNVAVNTMINDRWQLTGNWGAKYVKTDLLDEELSSWTHLLGAETRFDLTEWLDLGGRAQVLTGEAGTSYSYGPTIGVSPVDNLWVSLGYNVSGYSDDDFEAAEYSRKGPYIKLRFKFDQHSAEGLLRRISPESRRYKEWADSQPLPGSGPAPSTGASP